MFVTFTLSIRVQSGLVWRDLAGSCCVLCRCDFEIGVHLGLVESRPADPQVEECEPWEAAGHALVGTFHCLITGAHTDVDGEEDADDEGDGSEDGGANEEVVWLG